MPGMAGEIFLFGLVQLVTAKYFKFLTYGTGLQI